MFKRRQIYDSITRMIEIDRALAQGGIEIRSFALQLGVAPEQVRDDLSNLERLGQSIRHELFDGNRHFYSYARDQAPLFSRNVPASWALNTRLQSSWR